MTKRIFAAFCFSLLVAACADASLGIADDACVPCHKNVVLEVKSHIDRLETLHSRYRAKEKEIRHLYYHELWHARQKMIHETDKAERQEGHQLEDLAVTEIKSAEEESSELSNQFWHTFQELKARDRLSGGCCLHRPEYQNCIYQRFVEIYEIAESFEFFWTKLLEDERIYRKKVAQTVGGLKGLYLTDVLEDAGEHRELYWRFETELAPLRFEQDEWFRDQIIMLRRYLASGFSKADCCKLCV